MSVETDLGRWGLVLVKTDVHVYSFLVFSDLNLHIEEIKVGVLWQHCATW